MTQLVPVMRSMLQLHLTVTDKLKNWWRLMLKLLAWRQCSWHLWELRTAV